MAVEAKGIARKARGVGHQSFERGRACAGRGRDHDAAGFDALAAFEPQLETLVAALDRDDRGARSQRGRLEPRDERRHQLRQTAAQRVEGRRGARPRGGSASPRRSHEAAARSLELAQAREGGEDREPLRVARVDPREERLPQAVDGLLPEAAAQERRDRLVVVPAAAGEHEIEAHAQLAGPEKSRLRSIGSTRVGTASSIPSGSACQLPPVEDVDLPLLGVGRDEALAEAELTAQLDALRLLRQHRVGAGFEQEAALRLGPDHPAEAVARLEEHVAPSALVEGERRGQAARCRRRSSATVVFVTPGHVTPRGLTARGGGFHRLRGINVRVPPTSGVKGKQVESLRGPATVAGEPAPKAPVGRATRRPRRGSRGRSGAGP